jgi:small conductance mechanosensitive channel
MLLDVTPDVSDVSKVNPGVFEKWLQDMMPKAMSFFWSVVIALITWYVGMKIIKFIRKLIQKGFERRGIETGVRQFVDSVVKVILIIILIIVILNIFGIQTSSIAAAVASLGLTIGLALQGSLSNFAGGVLILVLHPFLVGDYIKEDTHGNEGTVKEISIFYTRLLTFDGKIVVIPNGTLANSSLTNYTKEGVRRLDLKTGISYGADIKKAREVLLSIGNDEEKRLKEKPLNVYVDELSDSSVIMNLQFWVRADDYWDVRFKSLEKIKYGLDAAGIEIPFPQLDIHERK